MSLIHLTKAAVPEYLRNNDTFGEAKGDAEFPSPLRPQGVVVRNGMTKKPKTRKSTLRNKQP